MKLRIRSQIPGKQSHAAKDSSSHCNTSACEKQDDVQPSTGVSTQEEADTLIMHVTCNRDLYSWKECTYHNPRHYVMVLALRRLTVRGLQTTILMGTGVNDRKRKILLKPIYVRLGTSKAAVLPGLHSLTGCDTCGHIKGIGKKTAFNMFKAFTETTPAEHSALSQLGVEEMPSSDVVSGYERFLCMLLGTKKQTNKQTQTKQKQKQNKQKTNLQANTFQYILKTEVEAL